MSKTQHSSIFTLPQDIIFDILSRLTTKSLIRFRCVCTSSLPLISHPSFTNLHLSSAATITEDHRVLIYYESTDYINHFFSLRSPITLKETLQLQPSYKTLHGGYLQIVGSNKGLICMLDTNYLTNHRNLILWNPSIQKFKIVDGPSRVCNIWSPFVLGFGFVSRTSEFKVVEIVCDSTHNIKNSVLVYSLSTNSWDKKEGVSAPCYLTRRWSSDVFVNGFVNWLAYKDEENRLESYVIMAFDLDDERFQVLELPKNMASHYRQVSINSYGEESLFLSLCASYFELNGESWEVWVMGDYGLVDSWKKVFVVWQSLSIPPLLMQNDHEVLIVLNDGRLMLLDTIKNEMQDLRTQGSPNTIRAIRRNIGLKSEIIIEATRFRELWARLRL